MLADEYARAWEAGTYERKDESGEFEAMALDGISLREGRISEVVSFLSGGTFGSFGLPAEVSA